MLSIDFGTTRTKVAYYDASRGRVSLANMGGDNAAFPSLFYVGTDGQVFCGSEAMDFLDSDPGGTIRRAKSRLRDRAIRVNGRTLRPVDLVTKLFASLRKRAGEEVPAFGGKAPVSVVLTLPAAGAGSGPVVEQIMRDAATAAGFTEVSLLTEPEGAATAWQHEEGGGADDVVVILDGGGGTVDWACLKRVDGTLRLFADCPPGGDDKVGGEYLDEDLFGILTSKLEAREATDALVTVQSQSNKWFSRIRGLRERFNRTGKVGTQDAMRVAGEVVSLEDAEVQGAIQDRFVNQVCAGFGRYLDSVRRATGVANPRVLLVGGTGQVSGLKEALREKCRCEPTWWQLSEFAPVIGAAWWGAERAGMLVGRAGGDKAERVVAQKSVPGEVSGQPDQVLANTPRPRTDVGLKDDAEAGTPQPARHVGDSGGQGTIAEAPSAQQDPASPAPSTAHEEGQRGARSAKKAPTPLVQADGNAILPATAGGLPAAVEKAGANPVAVNPGSMSGQAPRAPIGRHAADTMEAERAEGPALHIEPTGPAPSKTDRVAPQVPVSRGPNLRSQEDRATPHESPSGTGSRRSTSRVALAAAVLLAAAAAVSLIWGVGGLSLFGAPTLPVPGTMDQSGEVLAVVNGHAVQQSLLDATLAQLPPGTREKVMAQGQMSQVEEQVIVGELLYQEALREGLEADPETQSAVAYAQRDALSRMLLDSVNRERAPTGPLTDAGRTKVTEDYIAELKGKATIAAPGD